MKVENTPDGALVVTYDSSALTKLTLVVAVLFLGVAGYDVFLGERGTERAVGLLASAGTFVAIGLVFFETTSFQFAAATRTVTWRRRWALRQRAGTLAFGDIHSVLAERPIGDDGTPSRRIVLRTTGGATIPVTVGYQPDPDEAVLKIADRIRVLLGQAAGETRLQTVKRLMAAGRAVDAIRVLREEEGLTLTAAKERIDAMTRKGDQR